VIKDCEVCIRTKTLQYKPYRELQILSIFKRTSSSVIIDFIVKLFKFKNSVNNISYNNILVIVKRFTKYNKFILANESHSTKDLTNIIIREIINNHRLPDEFITDRSTTFTFKFFIIFIVRFGVNSKFFYSFSPLNRWINRTIQPDC